MISWCRSGVRLSPRIRRSLGKVFGLGGREKSVFLGRGLRFRMYMYNEGFRLETGGKKMDGGLYICVVSI